VLVSQPLFATLNEAELASLAGRAHPRRYAQGEVLFAEGDA
jgi:CRP-like cAMP-binding protein